jgi:hypothetical protein
VAAAPGVAPARRRPHGGSRGARAVLLSEAQRWLRPATPGPFIILPVVSQSAPQCVRQPAIPFPWAGTTAPGRQAGGSGWAVAGGRPAPGQVIPSRARPPRAFFSPLVCFAVRCSATCCVLRFCHGARLAALSTSAEASSAFWRQGCDWAGLGGWVRHTSKTKLHAPRVCDAVLGSDVGDAVGGLV